MKLKPVTAIEFKPSPETIDKGAGLFAQWCSVCHGLAAIGGGAIADLRYSQAPVFDKYTDIVLEGKYSSVGMPSFKKWLTAGDVEAIRAYILKRRSEIAASK